MSLDKALEAIRSGKMILLFDSEDREGETDFVIPALNTTPKDVALMRRDGGGLICVAIYGKAADKLGLPFMSDVLRSVSKMVINPLSPLWKRRVTSPTTPVHHSPSGSITGITSQGSQIMTAPLPLEK